MPKGRKKQKKEEPKQVSVDNDKYLKEAQDHHTSSDSFMSTLRDTFDDKESMLVPSLRDGMSQKAKSKVYDPRLSTIVFERAGRVSANRIDGKAFALTDDDVAKNALMNLKLDYDKENANEQFDFLTKQRLTIVYSQVYGSQFLLVPWRVNFDSGYIGPEMHLINMRNSFPQPNVPQVDSMDWFQVRTVVSIEWLKAQDKTVWDQNAIAQLETQIKEGKETASKRQEVDQNKHTLGYRERFPGAYSDVVYPMVEIITEYRRDLWITYAPDTINSKDSQPFMLRTVENPYPEGMLPIVAKHAFPLLDSPVGLGEFERGKSLQFAINSLINLYLEGVKYSIFPPLQIRLKDVTPSSMKWAAGARWFMKNPGSDVQPLNMSPQGINTFESTYGFLVSALMNALGGTEQSSATNVDSSLGKTPQALRLQAQLMGARDEWEQFMLERAMKQVMYRWTALNAHNLEQEVPIRLFGPEVTELQRRYPNQEIGLNISKSGQLGTVNVNKQILNDGAEKNEETGELDPIKWDFRIEAGSSVKPNIDQEMQQIDDMWEMLGNDGIRQKIEETKTINYGELFERSLKLKGMKDLDSIVTDKLPQEQALAAGGVPPVGPDGQPLGPQGPGPLPAPPAPATPTQAPPINPDEFTDPGARELAATILGGVQGIPAQ